VLKKPLKLSFLLVGGIDQSRIAMITLEPDTFHANMVFVFNAFNKPFGVHTALTRPEYRQDIQRSDQVTFRSPMSRIDTAQCLWPSSKPCFLIISTYKCPARSHTARAICQFALLIGAGHVIFDLEGCGIRWFADTNNSSDSGPKASA
jgi:hypothetical protein